MNSILNIALLAHVDAGKTSLTEQLLFQTGEIKRMGQVDKGQTVSDALAVEKSRGISVLASQMKFEFEGRKVNIIDTPGHADFISEVERSLLAVDLVVLLISAYEGVQSQTRNIWKILTNNRIPVLLVLNKIDREGFDLDRMVQQIRKELDKNIFPIQLATSAHIECSLYRSEFELFPELLEKIVEQEEHLMEQYLMEETIEKSILMEQYHKRWKNATLYPMVFTSAKTGLGIKELLHELTLFATDFDPESDFSAVVYKIAHEDILGKLSHLKILSGRLKKKQEVFLPNHQMQEKVNLIKQIFSNRMTDVSEAIAGDIVAVSGLKNIEIGDIIGSRYLNKKIEIQSVAVMHVKIGATDPQKYIPLSEALSKLNHEDPALDFNWYREEEAFQLKVNGKIQMEILQQLIMDRFAIEVAFDEPEVIYKETPKRSAIGFDAYTMPKPCWAVVKFQIEPGERGSGVVYATKIGVNDVLQKYQNEVERTIPLALKQGIKGWEVTDLKITLIEGEDHVMHSRPGDFIIATPMAIIKGLEEADSQLLEPILKYRIEAPETSLGSVTSEILNLRGSFEQPQFAEDNFILEALIPVATSMDFPTYLAAQTAGQALVTASFHSYKEVDDEFAKIRSYKGISPLDRSKYILKARRAIQ